MIITLQFYHLLCCLSFFICQLLHPASFTITQSGQYTLGDSISYSTTGPDQIIYINADDVILDLHNNIIQQTGGSGAVNGIEIAPTRKNVTIKNGTIQGVTGASIYVNNGCQNILLQNIETFTANQGVVLNGSAANNVVNCSLNNLTIRYTTSQAIAITNGSNIAVTNSLIDTCATTTFSIQCFSNTTQPSQGLLFNNVAVNNCGNGIQCARYRSVEFNNCTVYNCSFTGDFVGFNITAPSASTDICKNIYFYNCSVVSCAGNSSFTGFSLTNTNSATLFNCDIFFGIVPSGSAGKNFVIYQSNNIILEKCQASTTDASKGSGFEINSSSAITLLNCMASGAGTDATSGAFSLVNATACVLKECKALRRSPSAYAQVYGFYISGSSNNLFENCAASRYSASGFYLLSGSNNNIFKNCTVGNSVNNFNIQACSNNMFIDCATYFSSSTSFSLDATSAGNLIKKCIAFSSVTNYNNNNILNNVFDSNISVGSTTTGFNQTTSSSVPKYFNSVCSSTAGSNYVNVSFVVNSGGTVTVGANLNG